MPRIVSFQTAITLPRTTALTCFSLGQEVIDGSMAEKSKLEAQSKSFPTFLMSPLQRLITAHGDLAKALKPVLNSETSTREADSQLDNAWGSLYDMLTGWSKMDPSLCPDAQGVENLMKLLFADGKSFLQLNYKSEWAESDRRLEALRESPYAQSIESLGLRAVVAGIEQAQSNYGQVLGITEQATQNEVPAIKASHAALQESLREYATKALAWAEPNSPQTLELSKALLQPIETWEAPAPSSASSASNNDIESPENPEAIVA